MSKSRDRLGPCRFVQCALNVERTEGIGSNVRRSTNRRYKIKFLSLSLSLLRGYRYILSYLIKLNIYLRSWRERKEIQNLYDNNNNTSYVLVGGSEKRGEPESVPGMVAQGVRHERRAPPVPRGAAFRGRVRSRLRAKLKCTKSIATCEKRIEEI